MGLARRSRPAPIKAPTPMASRADNLASNFTLANFSKASDLKQRIWFTIGALIIFRFLSFVPLPGVNPLILETLYDQTRGGILDLFNTFSGGSLERMSLIALGIMPYITASIVVQLAGSLHPALIALKKEGETGRKKLNQYTRYGTVFLTALQGWFLAAGLESYAAQSGLAAVVLPGMMFRIGAVISLVGGTMFLLWIGEQITARGIGNGVSLIIMAGIVAQMPVFIGNLFEGGRSGSISAFTIVALLLAVVVLVLFICFMERAQRRLLIQYPKRASQRGMMQADRTVAPYPHRLSAGHGTAADRVHQRAIVGDGEVRCADGTDGDPTRKCDRLARERHRLLIERNRHQRVIRRHVDQVAALGVAHEEAPQQHLVGSGGC